MNKVTLFLNELEANCNASVPDPWYGTEEGYKTVYDLINKTCDAIIGRYSNNNKQQDSK
jgi:protein-tyrosine phosphatase